MESLSYLSAEQRQVIDQLADEFEVALRAGQRPSIENVLVANSALRPHLLKELIAIEIELRRAAGESPALADYKRRFPNDLSLVEAVFYPATGVATTVDQMQDTEVDEDDPPPERLGRYIIQRQLGRGGFGVVYLAHDPQLDRPVALKVPRRKRFKTPQQVASFMEEARTAAKLKHASLVSVHDVQEENGLPYVVQEYIDGNNLEQWVAKQQPSFEHIAKVLLGISEALGYAHQQGLTHCDLKLANVLIDSAGQPHVADFGLAVHESTQRHRKGEVFGTTAMMAPEQVRGESHRLDGRTDIWAIGVMLYQLLVGRRPFTGTNFKELFNEIQTLDPKPPRQIDRSVPRELERICLKCLSKHKSDRYNTTDDLGEDLSAWLKQADSTQVPTSSTVVSTADAPVVTPDSSSRSKPPAKIIPKGLRSFDAGDADFFLDLLPGPRDRDGLPDSIRFWKLRIEETEPDQTFSVGLMYGPSGCGKSSLVKAGLLPRLSDQVLAIYVEATGADTDVRILKQLRKHIPRLPADMSLVEACAEIRLTGAGRQRKVLLVIDQFEQWLHSHPGLKQAPLVDGLRQCEGERLQAMLLVRDDFFASVHRLFQELDDPLLEGRNYALIDKFDVDHARKVLIAFGRAYGKLGENLSDDQSQFVEQAVQELTEDGKIICVRLSLFADMMKMRSWIPSSLKDVGGVGGVGETFLEETFRAKAAPPSHRVHETAIRQVLKALLPDAGMDIKGGMRSEESLREAAGYQNEPDRFAEVVRILDQELRIITPVDWSEGWGTGDVGWGMEVENRNKYEFGENNGNNALSGSAGLAIGDGLGREVLSGDANISSGGVVRIGQSDKTSSEFDTGEHRRRARADAHEGISPTLEYRERVADGIGDTFDFEQPSKSAREKQAGRAPINFGSNQPNAQRPPQITPEKTRVASPPPPAPHPSPPAPQYQLTHDYLVPSLRRWLTRKQRETRRGRAELKLAERASFWNAKPENRYLPSFMEWISIRLRTDSKHWTGPQQAMMKKFGRVQAMRAIFVATGLYLAAVVYIAIWLHYHLMY